MEDARFEVNNFDPSLDEVLAEPIVRQLMRRDGVTEASVRQLMQQAAAARRRSQPKLRFTAPVPDAGRMRLPPLNVGAFTPAHPAWPRVFPSL